MEPNLHLALDGLREAETVYRIAVCDADLALAKRNAAVRDAIDSGWSQADVGRATGLTRGRINQIVTK